MKHVYPFLVIVLSLFISSCFIFTPYRISNKKYLEIENGNFFGRVVTIDKDKNQHEFILDPEWDIWLGEGLIGDFEFVHIKSENGLEGIFIIQNKYKKKLLSFDVLSKEEFNNMIIAEHLEEQEVMFYGIVIKINENEFEVLYNPLKFDISTYFSYQENFLLNKESKFKEYSYIE